MRCGPWGRFGSGRAMPPVSDGDVRGERAVTERAHEIRMPERLDGDRSGTDHPPGGGTWKAPGKPGLRPGHRAGPAPGRNRHPEGGRTYHDQDDVPRGQPASPSRAPNIPVVGAEPSDTFIATDDAASACEVCAQTIGHADGAGEMLMIHGRRDTTSDVERVARQWSQKWSRAEGLDIAQNLLPANPDVTLVFAQADGPVLRAAQGMRVSGDDRRAYVGGFDGDTAALPVLSLHGIDLDMRPGEVVALLDANGAGRSTLSNIVSGAVLPSSERVTWQGRPHAPVTPREAIDAGVGIAVPRADGAAACERGSCRRLCRLGRPHPVRRSGAIRVRRRLGLDRRRRCLGRRRADGVREGLSPDPLGFGHAARGRPDRRDRRLRRGCRLGTTPAAGWCLARACRSRCPLALGGRFGSERGWLRAMCRATPAGPASVAVPGPAPGQDDAASPAPLIARGRRAGSSR